MGLLRGKRPGGSRDPYAKQRPPVPPEIAKSAEIAEKSADYPGKSAGTLKISAEKCEKSANRRKSREKRHCCMQISCIKRAPIEKNVLLSIFFIKMAFTIVRSPSALRFCGRFSNKNNDKSGKTLDNGYKWKYISGQQRRFNAVKVLFSIGRPFYEAYPQIVENLENLGVEVSCLIKDYAADQRELMAYLKDADIYINGIDRVDKEVIDAAPSLKYILKYGTGVDNIDLDYAAEKGIFVTNAPGQNASSVAELAVGLMLSVSRQIPKSDRAVKAGGWGIAIGNELGGKRLGIIGFGSIGQKIAQLASGFGMEIVASGTYMNVQAARKWDVSFVELEELLETSDYVTVCTALKSSTYRMLDRKRLALMKRSAFLINIARGDIIDEGALYEVLKAGSIKGAALDVFSKEPTDSKLAGLPNVVATPHIGGATAECVRRIGKITEKNIGRFLSGLPVSHLVNTPQTIQ